LTNEQNEQFEKFVKQKEEEDRERSQQALAELQKQEKDKEASNNGEGDSGPLMIGMPIKDDVEFRRLIDIVDEEKRVAIEGYVFSAETKELRSGRTLLTFKITDYTSSIMVKMFSKEKEEPCLV